MGPPEKEDNTKKAGVPPEPLCLFCFPEDSSLYARKTYVNPLPAETRRQEREEFWLKKRTEARIRRRRVKEPVRNLRTFLLTSVKNEKSTPKPGLPSLFEVLETVKDAWPSPSSRNVVFRGQQDQTKGKTSQTTTSTQPRMKDEKLKFSPHLLNRRLSMPEELMRKYSTKEKTSEESETNKTAVEISPSSSSAFETARKKETDRTETKKSGADPQKEQSTKADACQQTSDSDDGKPKKTEQPKRVLQSDYYKQGQRILKVKEACTCREGRSSTSASAKEETDESGTSESLPSSSPTQLPKRDSSSGNVSSESDNLRCTCAELSSKETSTDLYLSGKSTLSQTVSDKSMSTQDSTVSINSVSTRGSTVSDNSNSTTPEVERTSAKETTTSPDYSPRTPRNRKNRRRDKKVFHYDKTCPKHSRNFLSLSYTRSQCPLHSDNQSEEPKTKTDVSTNTEHQEESTTQTVPGSGQKEETGKPKTDDKPQEESYKWAKLSQEELYMMQQLRHRRFIESQRKLSNPLPPTPDTDSMTACGTGSSYPETERLDQPIMIPRYSALPRSLSMLVNTSSADTSHNSDSDSLADSLEDQPVTHVHKLYFDTKKESKPVRGDVTIVQENKQRQRPLRGRAFFVSIKEPYGEDEMLESIEKIPQPPERIKNQIFERHLNLCTKHKLLQKGDERKEKPEAGQKKRKPMKDSDKIPKTKKTPQEENKKTDRKTEKTKRNEEQKPKPETVRKKKETKGKYNSKIPVLVSSPSASSSPEREPEPKEKPQRPKIRVKRPKEEPEKGVENPTKQTEVETTQILEITQTGAELSLQKPQAIIHPSQIPFEAKQEPQLTIPPLPSTLRMPTIRQSWNKQILFAQARRSPISRFRQRFEVIPEEKSSSLSSAEEKNGKGNAKYADASTSPLPSDAIQFHSYNVDEVPNLIVAKITNKQLETLPYVKGDDNQKIILFSSKPQNCNSTKGRDALIAMNREDFNRLAKGWMNFYKLNENMENDENEEKTKPEETEVNKQNNKKPPEKPKSENNQQQKESTKQDEPELGDSVRLDCSNTILRKSTSLTESDRSLKKENSLPELKLPSQRGCEVHKTNTMESLPKLGGNVEDNDEDDGDTDSDSTDYMEPPSPRVPPLPIDDIPSDATLSSSDDEFNGSKLHSLKYLQVKKRTTINKVKGTSLDTSRFGKKKDSAWSVTVAGTVELSRSAPDLEMRLSFPANGGPPVVSQSDSGFAEDSNYSKLSESLQDLDSYISRQEMSSRNLKQNWMVTVKNAKPGDIQHLSNELPRNSNPRLPDLELPQSRNPKKVLKDVQLDEKMRRVVERKMRAIWPKVQKVIRKEFLTESGRLITEVDDDVGYCLTVRGNAVSMEKKQKPPTMTERDVTRRYTSRPND